MVVPAKGLRVPLGVNGPPEFTAPDHQGFIQHSPVLQILDKRRRTLVGLLRKRREVPLYIAVMIPAAMEDLDKANPALGKPARQQAVGRVRAGFLRLLSVELEGALGLIRNIRKLRNGCLHPVGHLVLGQTGGDLRVADLRFPQAVELRQPIEHLPAFGACTSCGIIEVEHRVSLASKLDPLVFRRQKTAAPESVVERLSLVEGILAQQNHERGQVLGFAPQAVAEPGADTWPPGLLVSGLKKGHGRIVVDRLSVHGLNYTDLIYHLRHVRQQVTDPGSRLAMPPEFPRRLHQRKAFLARGHPGEPLPIADLRRQLRHVELLERWFVIEKVYLGRRARLEQVDHPLGLGGEMRNSRKPAQPSRSALPVPAEELRAEKRGQGGDPDACA